MIAPPWHFPVTLLIPIRRPEASRRVPANDPDELPVIEKLTVSRPEASRYRVLLPEPIASSRYHPQPGMHCSWCQFKNECMAWLPGMTLRDVQRAA